MKNSHLEVLNDYFEIIKYLQYKFIQATTVTQELYDLYLVVSVMHFE
jgi:hypothetical protein